MHSANSGLLGRLRRLTCVCACVIGSVQVLAEGVDAPKLQDLHQDQLAVAPALTLADVIEKAYERNPNVQTLGARLREADALERQASSFFPADPSIAVRHQTDAIGDGLGLQEWQGDFEFPIWWPGQKSARHLVADKANAQAGASAAALRLAVAGLVREALWDIALKENQVAISQREWETAQRLEHDVARRVELGELARTDLILTQQDTLAREAANLRANTDHRHSIHRYQVITGLSTVPGDYQEQPAKAEGIENQHPLLAEALAQVERAEADRERAREEKRGNPTLALSTRHEKPGGGIYENAFGVTLRVPLGLSAQSAPALAAVEVALAQAQARRDELKRQLDIALEEAVRDLASVQQELRVAEQQNALAEKNLELERKAFTLGETDVVSLLRVQTQAFASQRTVLQRRLEVHLRTARFNQAMGVMP